jgi:hypothetical protein
MAGEFALHMRRRVNEDGRVPISAQHHESVDPTMRVENEAFDRTLQFRQAVGINPVHLALHCVCATTSLRGEFSKRCASAERLEF